MPMIRRLYDRLTEGHARAVREHFYAGLDYQDKLARFLENHDEPRAAATFDLQNHEAAAILTFLSPGLRFFHQGQFEGRKKRISPHLVRAPHEPIIADIQKFYDRLLSMLKKPVFRDGSWQLLEPIPAWEGNGSWDSFIAFLWTGKDDIRVLVTVNYAQYDGQCYLRVPLPDITQRLCKLQDMMSGTSYERDGKEMESRGLYLDLQPWQYHVFDLKNSKYD